MSLTILGSRIFAGTMGSAVWSAPLKSGGWAQMSRGMPLTNNHVPSMVELPGADSTLAVGTLGYGAFLTHDDGKHWTAVPGAPSDPQTAKMVLAVAYAANRHALITGTPSGIYQVRLSTASTASS